MGDFPISDVSLFIKFEMSLLSCWLLHYSPISLYCVVLFSIHFDFTHLFICLSSLELGYSILITLKFLHFNISFYLKFLFHPPNENSSRKNSG
jgi:hypothetical protein